MSHYQGEKYYPPSNMWKLGETTSYNGEPIVGESGHKFPENGKAFKAKDD